MIMYAMIYGSIYMQNQKLFDKLKFIGYNQKKTYFEKRLNKISLLEISKFILTTFKTIEHK